MYIWQAFRTEVQRTAAKQFIDDFIANYVGNADRAFLPTLKNRPVLTGSMEAHFLLTVRVLRKEDFLQHITEKYSERKALFESLKKVYESEDFIEPPADML